MQVRGLFHGLEVGHELGQCAHRPERHGGILGDQTKAEDVERGANELKRAVAVAFFRVAREGFRVGQELDDDVDVLEDGFREVDDRDEGALDACERVPVIINSSSGGGGGDSGGGMRARVCVSRWGGAMSQNKQTNKQTKQNKKYNHFPNSSPRSLPPF